MSELKKARNERFQLPDSGPEQSVSLRTLYVENSTLPQVRQIRSSAAV